MMGSRATNNSLQTAHLMSTPSSGDNDVENVPSTSRSGGSLEEMRAVDASGEAGISPAIVSLITQTVRAALAAERADNPPFSLASTPPIPSVQAFPLCCPAQRTPFYLLVLELPGLRFQVGLLSLCLLLCLPLFRRLPIRRCPFSAQRARTTCRLVRLAMSQIVRLCLLRLLWINLSSLARGFR